MYVHDTCHGVVNEGLVLAFILDFNLAPRSLLYMDGTILIFSQDCSCIHATMSTRLEPWRPYEKHPLFLETKSKPSGTFRVIRDNKKMQANTRSVIAKHSNSTSVAA